jgi:EAL and modified HD-GYP domain-containing signal transduction protein
VDAAWCGAFCPGKQKLKSRVLTRWGCAENRVDMNRAATTPNASPDGNDAFVARQAILDRRNHVAGYELLYRNSPLNRFPGTEATQASSKVMDQATGVFGLDRLVPPGTRAFVNITREVLVGGMYRVLPPGRVVLELLETMPVDQDVTAACDVAVSEGYLLALDDYAFEADREPLLERARIVKLEWPAVKDHPRLREMTGALQETGHTLLAEKIDMQEQHAAAAGAGCSLFQGFYLFHPEMMRTRDVPVSKLQTIEVLRTVNKPGFKLEEVELLLRREMSLSVRLLRYLNSAAFALRSPVSSLYQALVFLGERSLRTWLNVAALAALGNESPPDLVTRSLVRARCCELVGFSVRSLGDVDCFLMGLLSHLDVMLGRPLPELLDATGVSSQLRSALLSGSGTAGKVFSAVLALERVHFNQAVAEADELGISQLTLAEAYLQAVEWADDVMAKW